MNFATFSAVGSPGTHFVTTGGQLPVTKLQQNNGSTLSQMVGMVGADGVQYVRALDGSTMPTQQLISVPIALPGQKPGDPQQTVQIQVLNPSLLQAQQQPKYQMQIQGFSQGGAVLTLAYSQDGNDSLRTALSESGFQMLALPQEVPIVQPAQTQNEEVPQTQMHQVFITPNHQIIINSPSDNKTLNNNNNDDEAIAGVFIKEEQEDCAGDDESSQGTETSDSTPWAANNSQHDLVKYFKSLPPQQTQALPASLQQFLRPLINEHKPTTEGVQIELVASGNNDDTLTQSNVEVKIENKKKKKYKKKPPKPARPKPGQIIIATSADGTAIFCCPECQMAYPDKDQLEVHLVVHKIERRFICGICGAGLKRKEHLERHKLGHNPERPFVCGVCRKGFKRREHLNLHTVMHSGVKTEMCNECGKGFYRKDHLRKHTRSHENKRARDEANEAVAVFDVPMTSTTSGTTTNTVTTNNYSLLPEITIHVPTSGNVQVPVQINIPQHVVSSLAAAHQQQQQSQQQQSQQQQSQQQEQQAHETQVQLEALLAQHS